MMIYGLKQQSKKILNKRKENENVNIIFSDLRFQNEVDMINELGGVVIKVNRPNLNIIDNHKSEKKQMK